MENEDQTNGSEYIDGSKLPKIRVVVRKRPMSQKELNKNDQDVVDMYEPQTIVVKELKEKVDLTKYVEEHQFIFDQVFDDGISNQDFYVQTVQPLVTALFLGSKVTCFAYGQTGSGKTHTMMGPPNDVNHQVPGMYLLAANDIFTLMEDDSMRDFSVYISFYEIYCGKLYDLLNNRKLVHARENANQKVKIMGLTEAQITSVDETMEVIDFGLSARMTGTTAANSDSSRSHAVLQVSIKQDNGKLFGKMSFIDLAGSERGADAFDSKKETRMDGAEINKSLLALKECIRALDQSKKHKPFRGSKLTMVLKDSFTGGNCKTVMVANIGPTISCCEHTLNTLRYADRVKELKKENRDQSNTLMLPRQSNNSKKYELQRKNSFEGKPKLTGLAAIQNNLENKKMVKNQSTRPQTAAYQKGTQLKSKSGISHAGLSNPTMKKMKTDVNEQNDGLKGVNQSRIKALLQNNPSGAAASLNRQYDNQVDNQDDIDIDDDPEKRLNESIKNAHKLRMESAQSSEINNKPRGLQKPTAVQRQPKPLASQPQAQPPRVGGSPLLEGAEEDGDNVDLGDLKARHERLVDLILEEEDELIASHHKFIENTINSIKEQEKLRHEVNLPGSDVEEYIISLDELLTHKQNDITRMKDMIANFHQHIKQEQSLSQKFYSMQGDEQADVGPDIDDY